MHHHCIELHSRMVPTGTLMRIGISGHQNIPKKAVAFMRGGVISVVSRFGEDLAGVCSLAAGADQLFASIILEHGGRLHIVIPSAEYETTFSEIEDLNRFRSLLNRADTVETLKFSKPSENAFLIAGQRVVDNSDLLLAVWDGQPAKGKGGTADIVEFARNRGTNVEVIWPPGVRR
jgi:hypothetical protein